MQIAILGSRGIPANYSGLEACIEETSSRLAKRGYRIQVYCRSKPGQPCPPLYKGVELVWLPAIASKHGETILHTALSTVHALRNLPRDTAIHLYGVGNAPFLAVFRALGYPVLISVDGQDWRRQKWNAVAKSYLRFAAAAAARLARYCIVDSQVVQAYYQRAFGTDNIRYIPYGHAETDSSAAASSGIFGRLGIEAGRYVLFVGRVVPEKGIHYLLRAYSQLDTDRKLLIVGAVQDAAYEAELRSVAPPNAVFAGPIYGADAQALYRNAYLYVHPSDVDGTSHALLSAMGSGLPVLVSDIPENLETVGGAGFSFRHADAGDLAKQLRALLNQPQLLAQAGLAAQKRIERHYNWDAVSDALELLYLDAYQGRNNR